MDRRIDGQMDRWIGKQRDGVTIERQRQRMEEVEGETETWMGNYIERERETNRLNSYCYKEPRIR